MVDQPRRRRSRLTRLVAMTAILLTAASAALTARAAPRLPAVIGDGMVLQRDARVPIWGWAAPGESITVRFAGQETTATADDAGRWRVSLDPLRASAEPATLTVAGESTIDLHDIVVGDVWLCAGQSNMQMGLARTEDGEAVVARANYPAIRLFNVANRIVGPSGDVNAKWAACSPASAARFSAVGYYFGRSLHEELDVPVGLINSSWGATRGEAWTPVEVMRSSDALRGAVEMTPERKAALAKAQAEYDAKLRAWEAAPADAEASGAAVVEKPLVPASLRPQNQAGACYEAMIRPLIPFAIRGATWYQGEGNLGSAERYRVLLPALIDAYRDAWGQGDFPFGIVQLPNNKPPPTEPGERSIWAELRDAQFHAFRTTSNTGLAVTIDVGDANDGHPKNKKDVGLRLARWALADVYDKPLVRSGPTFRSSSIDGGRVTITFDDAGAGLTTKGGELRGFVIAGSNRQWRWAKAEIAGNDRIVVWSEHVPEPVAVRYAWADNPAGANLTNDTGLPASPFRTDSGR